MNIFKRGMWGILALAVAAILLAPLGHARAQSTQGASACAVISLEQPRTAECDAEMLRYSASELVRPTTYNPETDGESRPRGVALPPDGLRYPLGWMLKAWYYSDAPGQPPPDYPKERVIQKATLMYLYATVNVNGMDWHLVGPGQWMTGEFVAAMRIPERPATISGRWIALDLTEQTLVAAVDDTPVFATLISGGWYGYGFTEEGQFNIYARAIRTTFRGPPWAEVPEYVLERVPFAQFFDGNFAFHGAYWHNWFGFPRSHGCVNVPVADAAWLWDWVNETEAEWGPTDGFRLPHPDKAPFVFVYRSPATGITPGFTG
ncbi:MAG: L,D-transpeptidase [Anaerolineae bacterium]|nr:L,D-transpeptidase [Anaerolineae bacterium]